MYDIACSVVIPSGQSTAQAVNDSTMQLRTWCLKVISLTCFASWQNVCQVVAILVPQESHSLYAAGTPSEALFR